MELAVEEMVPLKDKLKAKPLSEVVDNGWDRLSELYGVNMRRLAAQHNFKYH